MNDPKDIVVTISLGKEDNSLNQTIIDENKENKKVTKEHLFNNLMFHLRENLTKKLYKKTIKEIDVLFQQKYIDGYSRSWKLSILKIKAILKIVKHKIIKYLINHFEKIKIKYHINGIKRYFSYALNEINKFYENNEDTNIINNEEKVDDLLYCYYDYIYLISLFNKILGNIMESISYLSFIIRLNKETRLVVKSSKTIYKIEKCYILLSQILICNEDYFSSIEYLNIAMDICLKNIIYQTKDIYDGILLDGKREFRKNKNEKEIDNKKIRKTILNIVFIYLYRGVCYENLGKLKNSIRCYNQCLWFINNFSMNNYNHFSNLIKHILEKSLEYKETIDYLHKKIINYEYLQLKLKNQKTIDLDKDEKKGSHILSKSLCSKKFKGLANKLGKLKINEIDTVNKFEIKKNIKSLSLRKREGKDKNIFLSEIRLLNTYLREDFRVIIDDMDKIKSFDLDYSTREKIQKLVRKLYFDQNQKKLNSRKKNDFCISSRNIENKIGKMNSKEKVLQSY
jgi:tetratricopeptide (TPR) repeat protein